MICSSVNLDRFIVRLLYKEQTNPKSRTLQGSRSIGTRGQTLIEHHPDEGQAINSLLKLARTKQNRGYGG
ncbi:WGR domain-containing protein [Gemmobacter caeni]|uniref:WGR domain-containing protein n=1 Tax=Gemmobacter caeni TaxID=589035 RepID=UPI000D3CC799